MAKIKNVYACQHCGAQYPKWQGQCTDCGQWNTLVEEIDIAPSKSQTRIANYSGEQSTLTPIAAVKMQAQTRLSTGLGEFDHVLGGGLISDSVVLVGGDPGIGKSTLLLQILSQISQEHSALYVSGEESLQQIAVRAQRMKMDHSQLILLAETQVERIIALAKQAKPKVMVIDSIQTIYTNLTQSAPGGVSQVRESAAQLVQFAKQMGIAMFIIGHVTKEGMIAGPRVLEHMVDAVLYFEGRNDDRYRVIRAVKNRFGAVNEIGVFVMTDNGLKPISNPSALFLSGYQANVAGSIVMATWEGSRPLMIEIQALVDRSYLANPRRVVVGLEQNRLAMLLAVLHRHVGIATYDQDVFVNAVGGVRILETGADLALLLAVTSSLKNKPLPSDLIVFGEVGLSGEIRPVPNGQERIKEAAKHGFKKAIIPAGNMSKQMPAGIVVNAVKHVKDVSYEY